ncbi:MAG: polysaccharide deacetylase family protein [Acidobacteriota bacterium]|nr:polysaccharide deacetylase family protein [Acidobacteriota bacterium]
MAKLYGERGDGNRDLVLTFDDGPVAKTTGAILDVLAKHDIKAMFFTVGSNLATPNGAAVARRAQAEGHLIANHTFSHPNLRGLAKDKIRDELKRTHDLICECSGGCKYFRPPFGSSSAAVSEVLEELGYTTVLWNVDTLDWKLRSDAWVENAMPQIKAREDSIVLMHDIHRTTGDNLESLISRIKRIEGYRFTLY